MGLIFRLVVLIIVLGAVIYSIKYLNTNGINPSYLFLDQSAHTSFDVKNVSRFEWQTFDKRFVYDRSNGRHWTATKNEKIVDGLVTFLSQIQLNQVEQTGKPAIQVKLLVQNQPWEGSWDGLSFVWTAGPKKGFGEILNEKKNRVFFRGKYIFDDVTLDLCATRVTEILFQADGKNYDIIQAGRNWEFKNNKPSVNSVFIEKWLTQLCKVQIRYVIDSAYIPDKKTQEALSLRYVDNKQTNLVHVEGNLYLKDNMMGLVLDGLTPAVESLKKELAAPANP